VLRLKDGRIVEEKGLDDGVTSADGVGYPAQEPIAAHADCTTAGSARTAGLSERGRYQPRPDCTARAHLSKDINVLLHDSRKAASGLEPLWLQCPMTQGPISITIATDVGSLTKAWHSKIKIACPHCPEIHHFKVSEAFTNAAISDERLRGVFSKLS
jgi:hypothetical protein